MGGAAVTLIMQGEQSRDARRFAVREMHRELLKMAIDRPRLFDAWGYIPGQATEDRALLAYTNLVLNYYILLRQTGADLDEIRFYVRAMATTEWMQRYWAENGDVWQVTRYGREVTDLIDEEIRAARVRAATDTD